MNISDCGSPIPLGTGSPRCPNAVGINTLPRGVRVPVRRIFTSHDGLPLMEVEIVRMEFGLELPAERFRPPVRGTMVRDGR